MNEVLMQKKMVNKFQLKKFMLLKNAYKISKNKKIAIEGESNENFV